MTAWPPQTSSFYDKISRHLLLQAFPVCIPTDNENEISHLMIENNHEITPQAFCFYHATCHFQIPLASSHPFDDHSDTRMKTGVLNKAIGQMNKKLT